MSDGGDARVTLVTAGAGSAEQLSEADYREIYEELRNRTTLRLFAEFVESKVSFAWWSKYERGEARLDRERKAELRRAVGLPPLPVSVAEATAGVDPDARVWRVGDGAPAAPAQPDRVILVGAEVAVPLTLRLNGDLQVSFDCAPAGRSAQDADPAEECLVTGVTRPRRRVLSRAVRFSPDRWERLSSLRKEAGMTWDEFADWVATLCGV
jgi:hypothetical protein